MSRQSKSLEAVALVIDVGQTVIQEDGNGKSFLHKSKLCASKIVQRKIFSDTLDQFSLILVGSVETSNQQNYPHICTKNEWLTAPNWKMLKDIDGLSATSITTGDWLDGLVVAINLLKSESECKKLFTDLKIVVLSNFASPIRSKDQIGDIINTLKDLNIKLVVIGPESEDENQTSEEGFQKSKTQRKGVALISRVVDEIEGGVMCGFEEAMEQLDHFPKVIGRAQPWNCDLQVGNSIFIPVAAFKKFAEKKLFKFKKRSVEKSQTTQEMVFFHGDTQVEKADVINSYVFGQTFIPISGDDKSSMALQTEKCCQILGFTKKTNVPRHMLMGDGVMYVAPKHDVESSRKAITALVKAMLDLEMVAIVRKVYRKNTAPRIGVLIPRCEEKSYFFYYAQLPFAEDERFTRLPSLKNVKPDQQKLDAVDQLIEALDLSKFEGDEDPYSKLINPSVEHFNSMVVLKALNPTTPLPSEPSEAIKNLLSPKLEIFESALDALENIKSLFPLEEIEQKSYRKGATDIFNRTSANDEPSESLDNKSKDLPDSMASFVQSTVTEIGTVDPEGDFFKLSEKGESSNKLIDQMQIAIKKLFLTSSSTVGIQKPLSALSLLRTYCIIHNPLMYNSFVASLKDDILDRNYNECWGRIVHDKLGLIISEEAQESSISAQEAEVFYEIKKLESQSEINYEMEAEDMMDMI